VEDPTDVVQRADSELDLHGDENVNQSDAAILAMYGVLDPLEVTAVVALDEVGALAADDLAAQEEAPAGRTFL
jgi:hypothetical protein